MPSHHEVAHAWAHQTGKQRNGKRVFYEGPAIYSHGRHFMIARLVDVKGVPSVLFTTQRYSVSTSKHVAIVAGASRHLPTYYVRDPGTAPSRDDWENQVEYAHAAAQKAARAKLDHNKNWQLAVAQDHADRANALNDAFDLNLPAVTLETLGVMLADKTARLEKARKADLKRRVKEAKERFKRETEARIAWLAGEPSYWRGTAPDGTALLRVKGNMLETSLGASVPLPHAIRAFTAIQAAHDTQTAWARNGHTLHVGAFQIDAIAPNGDFKAGCHSITWAETARIAKALDLF